MAMPAPVAFTASQRCISARVQNRTAYLDKERGDVGSNEHDSDSLRGDEEVCVRVNVTRKASHEHILGRDERAWLQNTRIVHIHQAPADTIETCTKHTESTMKR